jgi:hypothetical protein
MQLNEFLKATQIIRMLYGYDVAKRFFQENVNKFDKVLEFDYSSINQRQKILIKEVV